METDKPKLSRSEIGRLGWQTHQANGTKYVFTLEDQQNGGQSLVDSGRLHKFTVDQAAKGGQAVAEKYSSEFLKERSRKGHAAKKAKKAAAMIRAPKLSLRERLGEQAYHQRMSEIGRIGGINSQARRKPPSSL